MNYLSTPPHFRISLLVIVTLLFLSGMSFSTASPGFYPDHSLFHPTLLPSPFTVAVTASGDEDCWATLDGWFTVTMTGGTNPFTIYVYFNTVLLKSIILYQGNSWTFSGLQAGAYVIIVVDDDADAAQTSIQLGDSRPLRWPYQPQNGTNREMGISVTNNGMGDVYAAGIFSGDVDFDNTSLSCTGLQNIFLAAFDQCGYCQWAIQTGGYTNEVKAISLDQNGNIIMVGRFDDNIQFLPFGPTLYSIDGDAFVAKFSCSSGACLWADQIGSNREDIATGVAVDAFNNIFVFGNYGGVPLNFYDPLGNPQFPITGINGLSDNFIALADNTGKWMDSNHDLVTDMITPRTEFSGGMCWHPVSPTPTGSVVIVTGAQDNFFFGQKIFVEYNIGYPFFTSNQYNNSYQLSNSNLNYTYKGTDVATNMDQYGDEMVWFCGDITDPSDFNSFIAMDYIAGIAVPYYEIGLLSYPPSPPPQYVNATSLAANDRYGTFVAGQFQTHTALFPTSQVAGCQNPGSLAYNSTPLAPNNDFYVMNFDNVSCPNQLFPLCSYSTDDEFISDISLGRKGEAYVTGCFDNTALCFVNMNLNAFQNSRDAFIGRILIDDAIMNQPIMAKPASVISLKENPAGSIIALSVLPNPVRDNYINIKLCSEKNINAHLQLLNLHGQVVMDFGGLDLQSGQAVRKELGHIPAGCYFLRCDTQDAVSCSKFLIQ